MSKSYDNYIGITEVVVPSNFQHEWKDVIGMEYAHYVHHVAGGFPVYSKTSMLMRTWWIENFGTFIPEAIQVEFGDIYGISGDNQGVYGHFTTCRDIETTPWYRPQEYRDPISSSDTYGIYCPVAAILWDFYDDSPISDDKTGENEDETVNIPLTLLWNTLSSQPIYSLRDLYLVLITLDINNNGIKGDAQDIELVDSIFILHGAPGGYEQN